MGIQFTLNVKKNDRKERERELFEKIKVKRACAKRRGSATAKFRPATLQVYGIVAVVVYLLFLSHYLSLYTCFSITSATFIASPYTCIII